MKIAQNKTERKEYQRMIIKKIWANPDYKEKMGKIIREKNPITGRFIKG